MINSKLCFLFNCDKGIIPIGFLGITVGGGEGGRGDGGASSFGWSGGGGEGELRGGGNASSASGGGGEGTRGGNGGGGVGTDIGCAAAAFLAATRRAYSGSTLYCTPNLCESIGGVFRVSPTRFSLMGGVSHGGSDGESRRCVGWVRV